MTRIPRNSTVSNRRSCRSALLLLSFLWGLPLLSCQDDPGPLGSKPPESTPVSVGIRPALGPVAGTALRGYQPNIIDHTVSVLDLENHLVFETVTLDTGNPANPTAGAWAATVSKDGLYAYVGDRGVGQITVLSTLTNHVVAAIDVPGDVSDLVVSEDGNTLYVAIAHKWVSFIDTRTNSVIQNVSTGGGGEPSRIALNADGSLLFVGNKHGEDVDVIDTATRSLVGSPILGSDPMGLALSPDGSELYVGLAGDHTIKVLSSSAPFSEIRSFPTGSATGPRDIWLAPDGTLLYTSGNHGTPKVRVFDASTGNLRTDLGFNSGSPAYWTFDPASNQLFGSTFAGSLSRWVWFPGLGIGSFLSTGVGSGGGILGLGYVPDLDNVLTTESPVGTVGNRVEDFEPPAFDPATDLDAVVERTGVSFAERFDGQNLWSGDPTDRLSGMPDGPLSLVAGDPGENLHWAQVDGSYRLFGLYAGGGPDPIGHGTIAAFFDQDQSALQLTLGCSTCGHDATIQVFSRDGSLLDVIDVRLDAPKTLELERVGGAADIAGFSIHAEGDFYLDDLRYDGLQCGDTVSADLTLAADLVCPPGFDGIALTVMGTGTVFDGAGHEIVAPGAAVAIRASGDGLQILNVTANGPATNAGIGVELDGATSTLVQGVTAQGREFGVTGNGETVTVAGNMLFGTTNGIDLTGDHHVFHDNDVGGTTRGIVVRGSGFTIQNDNDYTDASRAILILDAESTVIDGLDIPASVVDRGIGILNGSNLTLRNITIGGSPSMEGAGIHIRASTDIVLENVEVSGRTIGVFGGEGAVRIGIENGTFSGNHTGVFLHSGEELMVSESVFSDNDGAGLMLAAPNSTINGSTFSSNLVGIDHLAGAGIVLRGNVFEGNSSYGVKTSVNTSWIDAEDNYWGDPSGPNDDDEPVDGQNDPLGLSNPDGPGDAVTDFVDYRPWRSGPDPEPDTPETALVNLTDDVLDLAATGTLAPDQAGALGAKLESASSSLEKGNKNAVQTAGNQIQAFMNQVEAFMNSGNLTQAEGQALLDAAQAILTELEVESLYASVSAGENHTCALRTDGSAVCWGRDDYGQASPPAGARFLQVSAGGLHTCGILTDRSLACWGFNVYGQRNHPGGNDFTQVAAGFLHTCAIRTDGSLACWGADHHGQASPPPSTDYVQVGAGVYHNCAVKIDGSLACWGSNRDGMATPPPGSDYQEVGAGSQHSCAIRTSGTIICWGFSGQYATYPPGGTYTQLSAGYYGSCAVRTNGSLTCWGGDIKGQLTPPTGADFKQVSVGATHSCAARNDGTLTCWGENKYGKTNVP